MQKNTPQQSQSSQNPDAEKSNSKPDPSKVAKETVAAKESNGEGQSGNTNIPELPKVQKAIDPAIDLKGDPNGSVKNPEKNPATKNAPVKKPRRKKESKKRESKKIHKKKGEGSETSPSSIRLTDGGFGALLAIEAENPEMTRNQIVSTALMLLAQHIAYLPPIQLARINNESLMTLAGAAAKWEKSGKEILRKIMLAEYDEEEKAKHAGEMEINLKHFRENRLTLCRMAGIQITHGLSSDMNIAIDGLSKLKKENDSLKTFQTAFDHAILILTAYKQVDSAVDTPKPAKATEKAMEDDEIPDPFETPLPPETLNPQPDETSN